MKDEIVYVEFVPSDDEEFIWAQITWRGKTFNIGAVSRRSCEADSEFYVSFQSLVKEHLARHLKKVWGAQSVVEQRASH